ncbi:hypothetical protein Tco_0598960 [Tanacetum coccineum]
MESNNNNKAEKSEYSYSYFYGSDGEDTDEEDWPQLRDTETRERMLLESGPLIVLTEKRLKRLGNYTRSILPTDRVECTNLPTPPPQQPLPLSPPPSPPRSLDFQEQVRPYTQLCHNLPCDDYYLHSDPMLLSSYYYHDVETKLNP